ncbi:MAG TPA: cupredoxin domain-containing protein [Candidatus Paceibacterota bacterium]|nr:cupredoxin domain-containing protein [Candidatus Paceibacterota bacterium]
MTRRQIVILVAVGLFVAVGIVFGVIYKKPIRTVDTGPVSKNGVPAFPDLGIKPGDVFSPQVPENMEPTVPAEQSAAAPGAEEKLGIFKMTVNSSGFDPSNITVNLGDIVQILITASGDDFDFSVPYSGLYTKVNDGETKQVTFGATSAGTFVFQCRDFCPQGKTISGSIIVLP